MPSTVSTLRNAYWARLTILLGRAPDSVRNQIFDHKTSATTAWYLDKEVRCDTQAIFLERSSNEIVQKIARLMTLTADPNAPTKYTDKESKKVANHPDVISLSQRRQHLTGILRDTYGFVRNAPSTDPIMRERASVEATLYTLKEKLRSKYFVRNRKRFFRTADTIMLEAQLDDGTRSGTTCQETPPTRPLKYEIQEREWVVGLMCDHIANLTDQERRVRRIEAIKRRATLCNRLESRYRPRLDGTRQSDSGTLCEYPVEQDTNCTNLFPLVCRPTQCPICIGDERKSYSDRTREFSRPSKMMDHVATHLEMYLPGASIPCHHPICMADGVVLESIAAFKNHTARVHKINLRQ